ncbi:response regulator [Candidatus Endoriftia persephone]|jgi:two-component system sensor histidine kinase RpfC|uniref:Sensory/regulatory protein rpfC n=2 Tax=Gammaproteobacteria TaxID=1236 RepID=G2DFL6_9GAMM|nr:response regulator [Candidatus Endoriftia persephone]EGV50576.1 sensory/regulatory protein rpfC [endosymbiont of Riftia pachyptila (vent Ph05)]USF86160.1 response regulator [Candidatus Endoriftia persephone]
MDKRSQSQHNVLPGLNQFPDLEIEHAGIRLLISVPLFVWFAAQSYLFFDFSLTKVPFLVACGYILISAALLVRIINSPVPSKPRRLFGILVDIASISLLLRFSGDQGLFLVALYPLFIASNGYHFGTSYLYFTLATTILGVAAAFINIPFDGAHLAQGIGVILAFIGFSTFFASILNNLTPSALNELDTYDDLDDRTSTGTPLTDLPGMQERAASNAEDGRPESNTNNSDEILATPQGKQRVLVLSHDSTHAERLGEFLGEWNHDFRIVPNSIRAFATIFGALENPDETPFSVMIVDQRHLDVDPIQISTAIDQEPRLFGLILIYIGPRQPESYRERLSASGYTHILETPLNKSLLFAAIRSQHGISDERTQITSLLGRLHKQQQPVLPPQDILLAESNASDRNLMERILKRAGHKVYTVENGEQALDALESHHFDLAIVNMAMPVMSGIQVIKLHHFTRSVTRWMPFIVISEQNTPDTVRECEQVRADACMFKPIESHEFLKVLTETILAGEPESDNSALIEERPGQATTRFHNPEILDTLVLDNLENLGNAPDFIADLVNRFTLESNQILEQMETTLNTGDAPAFRYHAHLLVDSAGHLGAFALYEMSLSATRIDDKSFDEKAPGLLEQMKSVYALTSTRFTEYLSERENSASRRS